MKIQKAYRLTVKNLVIDEPWYYDNIIVYAESPGEAKVKGICEFELGQVEDYSKRNYNGEFLRDITYLDVRARRIKSEDKILYEDKWRTREEIGRKEWEKQRDEEAKQLWKSNPDGIAVVWAGCYKSFWGANHSGYYVKLENAGKYSTKEAYEIVKGSEYSRQETVILLDIDKYNSELEKKIEKLKSSMI